jgi:hypothetical protein
MNFKEKYMQDFCSFESINNEIDLWHETTPEVQASESRDYLSLLENKPLHEYLGLSFEEYRYFVEDSNLLKIKLDFDKSLATLKLELIGFAHYNPYDGTFLYDMFYLEGEPASNLEGSYSDAILTKINNPAYTKLLAIENFLKEKDLLYEVEGCKVQFNIKGGRLDYIIHADLKEGSTKQDLKKRIEERLCVYNSSKKAVTYLLYKAWGSQQPIENNEIIICNNNFIKALEVPNGHTIIDQGPFLMEITQDGPFKGKSLYFRIIEKDRFAVLTWEEYKPKKPTLKILTSREIYTSPYTKGFKLSDMYGWHSPKIPHPYFGV